MKISTRIIALFLLWMPTIAFAQNDLDKVAFDHAQASFQDFYDLISLPNDALYPEDIEANVVWVENAFEKRGFTTTRIETEVLPLLLAEKHLSDDAKTVLVYLQIDGQPVDSSKWDQESPWDPVLKRQNAEGNWNQIPWTSLSSDYQADDRIFARSTADDKGPAVMFLAALDAIAELNINPNYNLKIILDFEEELGSPRLPEAVKQNQELLASDMLVIFDGPRHISNQPTLTYGARGITTVSLTVFGPKVPQHSGHYGNYVPNPALKLAQLLASMKDSAGRVTIPGWYDGISFSDEVQGILTQVPDDEAALKAKIGISEADGVGSSYQESIQYPSLNIRGMQSGWVGSESRTIIPATAVAEIDIRLVKEISSDQLISMLKQHISGQGFHFVDNEPTDEERAQYPNLIKFDYEYSYGSFRTSFDSGIGVWLRKSMVKAFGHDPIQVRMFGGSIPISPFVTTLDIPAVVVPTVNPDNNQHSPNENIRLGNYVDGIKTMIAILSEKL